MANKVIPVKEVKQEENKIPPVQENHYNPSTQLSIQDLQALARISQLPEWQNLQKVIENRLIRDKNSILKLSEYDTHKLAVDKAYLRGRIEALILLKREINRSPLILEKIATRGEKKEK